MAIMKTSDIYKDLLLKHRPTMPADKTEHARLVQILESMQRDGHTLSAEELRFSEMVTVLVLEYERKVCPMPVVPALEMVKYLAAEKGLRQADFIGTVGSRSYVNQIFTGRRNITPGVAQKLAKVLRVSPETLLPNYAFRLRTTEAA